MCNAQHIMRGVIEGTAYLHDDMHIQHFDLKGIHVHVYHYKYGSTYNVVQV